MRTIRYPNIDRRSSSKHMHAAAASHHPLNLTGGNRSVITQHEMRAFNSLKAGLMLWATPLAIAAEGSSFGVVGTAEDLVVRVTSPSPNRRYQTRGLKPGVLVDIMEQGPLASAIRARPEAYELCVDFSHPHSFISCKVLTSATNLAAADLRSFHEGSHEFRAFLRPHPVVVANDKATVAAGGPQPIPLLSEADLAPAAVHVPYATGALQVPSSGLSPSNSTSGGSSTTSSGSSSTTSPSRPTSLNSNGGSVEWVVALHYSHDAHVAVLHWGIPVYVLELERLVAKRYYSGIFVGEKEKLAAQRAWQLASDQVRAATGVEAFGVGVFSQVYTEFGGPLEESFSGALAIAQAAFPIAAFPIASSSSLSSTWVEVDHHRSHAALGLWDAHRELGIRRPLVLSYDGGGNDGFTLAFLGNVDAVSSGSGSSDSSDSGGSKSAGISITTGGGVALSTSDGEGLDYRDALTSIELHAHMSEMNWGNAYAAVGAALPEVARMSCPITHRQRGFCNASVAPNYHKGSSSGSDSSDERSSSNSTNQKVEEMLRNALTSPARLALSGKLMGYAGLGQAHPALVAEVRKELEGCAIYATMLSKDEGMTGGYERCMAEFGVGYGPGGQGFLDTPAIVARAAAYPGDQAYAYSAPPALKTVAAASSSSAATDEGSKVVSRRAQRDVAASAQHLMEEEVIAMVREILANLPRDAAVDGLVIVGGCALNVRVNSRLAGAFPHLPIHVPAAPSDCGLAVGSGWLIAPPPLHGPSLNLHLLGPTLFDLKYVNDHRANGLQVFHRPDSSRLAGGTSVDSSSSGGVAHGGGGGGAAASSPSSLQLPEPFLLYASEVKLMSLGGVRLGGGDPVKLAQEVAAILADDQVIGVVRGRAEHGPRALGHRSLLSAPSKGMKERMNALKAREWYRPVAPMLLAEDADRVFARDTPQRSLHSPFMSFAPVMLPDAAKALPAVAHADLTARPQTVTADSDPWIYALLSAVKQETGWGVLINTSFNTKGKPILNTLSEALALLRDCDDLDYVLIEDFLFTKAAVLGLQS